MFKFQEIYNAYIKCRKNKRNTINALSFEIDLLQNLGNLKDSLNTYSYTPKMI
ncbi:MAG: hypothetical protein U9Q30_07040 [Campylobacterota bacterium]|nr:hypothetical protein [Campylobacterota bacterium]